MRGMLILWRMSSVCQLGMAQALSCKFSKLEPLFLLSGTCILSRPPGDQRTLLVNVNAKEEGKRWKAESFANLDFSVS